MLRYSQLDSSHQTMAFRARWLMMDADTWISDGYVEVSSNGFITNCGTFPKKQPANLTDLGNGLLMPALVNAHTHLELSALKNCIPMDMGFKAWVNSLIIERTLMGPERLTSEAKKACNTLWETGVCAVGEISSLGLTRDILIQSQLNGVWFFEHFGNEIPLPIDEDLTTGNLYFSLAGHAPHTTSPELFRELKRKSFGKPFSIHVAESDLEMEFIKHAKGSWADFLVSREVDFSKWGLPQKSPVKHLDHIGILDKQTLIVHLLHCDDSDLSILKNRQCSVCICPRSNHNLHKRLPNIEDMIKKGLNVCLGTDSLASVNSLSIWDEMKYIWANYPNLSPKRILSMATSAGAMALGCGHQLGRIEPGYRACLLYVPVDSSNDENIAHHLVAADTVEKHLSLL